MSTFNVYLNGKKIGDGYTIYNGGETIQYCGIRNIIIKTDAKKPRAVVIIIYLFFFLLKKYQRSVLCFVDQKEQVYRGKQINNPGISCTMNGISSFLGKPCDDGGVLDLYADSGGIIG